MSADGRDCMVPCGGTGVEEYTLLSIEKESEIAQASDSEKALLQPETGDPNQSGEAHSMSVSKPRLVSLKCAVAGALCLAGLCSIGWICGLRPSGLHVPSTGFMTSSKHNEDSQALNKETSEARYHHEDFDKHVAHIHHEHAEDFPASEKKSVEVRSQKDREEQSVRSHGKHHEDHQTSGKETAEEQSAHKDHEEQSAHSHDKHHEDHQTSSKETDEEQSAHKDHEEQSTHSHDEHHEDHAQSDKEAAEERSSHKDHDKKSAHSHHKQDKNNGHQGQSSSHGESRKQAARKDFVWTAHQHFDLAGTADAGTMSAKDISKVQRHCENHGYVGFSVRGKKAFMKTFDRPLNKEDLEFMGHDDGVIFYTYGPPKKMQWQAFKHFDYPKHDAETVHGEDIETLKRYAEKKGYVGFSYWHKKAFMKVVDEPLTKKRLKWMGDDDSVVFYIPDPNAPAEGSATYFDPDTSWRGTCSTSGKDCRRTQCCSDPNDMCFEKDDGWAACMHGCSPGHHDGDGMWSCNILGEVRVPGLSLFCFAVVQSKGTKLDLIKSQLHHGAGIALCDEHMVFSDERVKLERGSWTTPISPFDVAHTGDDVESKDLQLSAQTHFAAWEMLLDHYIWRVHDWMVKVDPETVFFPKQLKVQLRDHAEGFHQIDRGHGVYLRTCVQDLPRMTAALEVVSQKAMAKFTFNRAQCPLAKSTNLTEDAWLQQCLEHLDVVGARVGELVVDGFCNKHRAKTPSSHCDFSTVAYHPAASVHAWEHCWNHAGSMYIRK